MISKVQEISEYLRKLDVKEDDALEFLIENGIRTNINHSYIVRKIISQLEVRDHIHNFADLLQTQDASQVLRQIVANQPPSLMKKIMQMDNSRRYEVHIIDANNHLPSPYEQIMLMYDYKEEVSLAIPKKKNILQSLLDKFGKKGISFESRPAKNKADKIIESQYEIPEEIKGKEAELASLKWYEVGKKAKLKREIEELQKKKSKYSKEILQYVPTGSIKDEKPEVQRWWEDFYTSHEQEMLNFISFYMNTKMRQNLSPEERYQAISQSMGIYFSSISRI